MFETLTIPFSQPEPTTGRGDVWARLEQEYKPAGRDNANLSDLSQMLSLARAGQSAYTHIDNTCSYVRIEGDTITVGLDFYVWPSSLALEYSLKADLGTISAAEIIEEYRSFDAVFQGSDREDLLYIFDGTLTPEMPFIKSNGEILDGVEVIVEESSASLSESAYCALRAEGRVSGLKHTIEMVFNKSGEGTDNVNNNFRTGVWSEAGGSYDQNSYPLIHHTEAVEDSYTITLVSGTTFKVEDSVGHHLGWGDLHTDYTNSFFTLRSEGWGDAAFWELGDYLTFSVVADTSTGTLALGNKVENLANTITLAWTDENNEEQTDAIELEIPPCVTALLEDCPNGEPKIIIGCLGYNCDDKDPYYVVRVNGCSGHIISQGWESNA